MTAQPKALRLADELLDGMSDEHWSQLSADAAAELRRLHAENIQWRSVFGHLGTPDEIGNEWIALQDKQAQDEALLRQALEALEVFATCYSDGNAAITALRERLGENT